MPYKRVRSMEERALVDELVADLGYLIIENGLLSPEEISAETRTLWYEAGLGVIRAANAVSTAALGSDTNSIDRARVAVDGARTAVRAARAAARRDHRQ